MDFNQAQIDILGWITGFVERPNANLAGWPPCPFARRARLNGEFEIRRGDVGPWHDLQNVDLQEKTVVAYVYDPKTQDVDRFGSEIDRVNRECLVPRDLLALGDHPQDTEEVKQVRFNQGTWAIVFVQPLSKLNEAAGMIATQGYYQGWPPEYLKNLFAHRQVPINFDP
jgi:hypothetical protein